MYCSKNTDSMIDKMYLRKYTFRVDYKPVNRFINIANDFTFKNSTSITSFFIVGIKKSC